MKRTYVRPTMVGERFVANIIIQGLMERLMEYTIKTIELNF